VARARQSLVGVKIEKDRSTTPAVKDELGKAAVLELVEAQVARGPKRGRHYPESLVAAGLVGPVTIMLLEGWSTRAVEERLARERGVRVDFSTIARFKRQYLEPLASVPERARMAMAEQRGRISVLDELADLIDSSRETMKMAHELGKKAGIPLEVQLDAEEQHRKNLVAYAEIEERELGLTRTVVGAIQQFNFGVGTKAPEKVTDDELRGMSDEELRKYLALIPAVDATEDHSPTADDSGGKPSPVPARG